MCAPESHPQAADSARQTHKQILTWIQRNPKKLLYKRFNQRRGGPRADPTSVPEGGPRADLRNASSHLRVISDAAYKKETEDGYSLRGALFLRGQGHDSSDFTQASVIHILDWACRSQRHVTRSTFSAELLAAGDAVDQGILISHMVHELENGPMTAFDARNRRMHG